MSNCFLTCQDNHHVSMCWLQNFPCQEVERHNKPEVELKYVHWFQKDFFPFMFVFLSSFAHYRILISFLTLEYVIERESEYALTSEDIFFFKNAYSIYFLHCLKFFLGGSVLYSLYNLVDRKLVENIIFV